MSLHLTPSMLVGAYDFLRVMPPFRALRLPHSDDVEFRVIEARTYYGQHNMKGGQHIIEVSAPQVGHTQTLLSVMAHEMVHLWQTVNGCRDTHGASFQGLAARVCRYHGFDPKSF